MGKLSQLWRVTGVGCTSSMLAWPIEWLPVGATAKTGGSDRAACSFPYLTTLNKLLGHAFRVRAESATRFVKAKESGTKRKQGPKWTVRTVAIIP